MCTINRQKFLAELGKLLTFMYDEDRQLALSMYERMFDEVPDEQLLLQHLLSPTRQAVVIARAYDSKARKLQVHAETRDESLGDNPKFIEAIERIELDILNRLHVVPEEEVSSEPVVSEDQFSLFDTEPAEDAPAPEIDEPELPDSDDALEEDASDEMTEEPEDAETEEPVSEEAEDEVPEKDEVDSFIEEFSIAPAGEAVPEEADSTKSAEPSVPETEAVPETPAVKRKVRVFLLLLMLIVFVPLTIVVCALLLIPTFLSLGAAAGAIGAGAITVTAAFSGFAVFADIMVVLGAALVLLAFGLLFLWLFVWFIGGAIVGFVRAVINLIRKCCVKEVSA